MLQVIGAAKVIIKKLLCSVHDSSVFPLKKKQTKQKQFSKKKACFTEISQAITMHHAPVTSRAEEGNGTNTSLS